MDHRAASLVWVLVDDVPRHVSDFAVLAPPKRPAARCPHCGRRLVLKLGSVRRHHAAHDVAHECAANAPESALHLDCKFALADALRAASDGRSTLIVQQACADADRIEAADCEQRRTFTWVDAWSDVHVEHRLDDLHRPDILLLRDGAAVGAIEIVASNAVSTQKAEALERLGVPWIEIRARESLTTPGSWTPRTPLDILRTSPGGEWRCAVHAARYAECRSREAALRASEREAERHTTVLRAARVVDLYHGGGARERFIYRVVELLVDGVSRGLRLQRGTIAVHEISFDDEARNRAAMWTRLRLALADDVRGLARNEHTFSDSPMRWARGAIAEAIVDEALMDRVGADPTPLATRYPRRWFYFKDEKRWFLPPDMQHVRWDRESPDAFAAHPAWARSHSVVRERPAPEGSWKTPVFARRPVGAMFTGGAVAGVRAIAPGVSVVELHAATNRWIVVLERALDAAVVRECRALVSSNDVLWISHPRDWRDALGEVAWAPAGRDDRGRGGIVIDGLGIFRADAFASAFARGDRRVTPQAIRARLTDRVARLAMHTGNAHGSRS